MPNGRKRLGWPETSIKLAFDIASYRSEDPSVQVGAVAIKFDNSLLLGYNGAQPGQEIDWSNREEKRKRVRHAEFNVLNNVLPNEVKILAVSHLPCIECLKIIAAKNIKLVYYNKILDHYSPDDTFKIAKELGIELIKIEI